MSKIQLWEVQLKQECIYCKDCDQEMVALRNTFYTYKCPKCGKEEHSRIKYPKIIIQ